ncbi:MAG: 2-dehydropantoate 2-reductase [Betaproteobacteria bacterium]|nr:2-dehydropantoate 2-reductase [Betaproteobacteria bacterium]
MSTAGGGPWPKVAVFGAGAVGCYYGGMLARAGAPVTLVGRRAHVEALRREGALLFEAHGSLERVPVAASTEAAGVAGASCVLFCVKSGDTEGGARAIGPHLARDATVVSLQNGVDNAARIAPLVDAPVIAAVVYVGCEMAGPGHVRHMGRGELVVGARGSAARGAQRATTVSALFARAGVPCRVTDNVDGELWGKLIINCAYNALCALSRLPYGPMIGSPWSREVMPQVVAEALAVARAEGVQLESDGLLERVLAIGAAMPGQFSSTAQDIGLGKPTEIDALNGYVARRGAALGVAAPVNRTLHALVKLLELGTAKPGS